MNRHRLSIIAGILLVGVALTMLSACGATPTPTPPPIPTAPPLMELGVNGLNGPRQANGNVSEAVAVGATRDRWSVEWFWVEQPWRHDLPWGEGNLNWQGVFPTLRDPTGKEPPTAPIPFDIANIPARAELPPLVTLHGIPRLYDCTYWSVEQYPDYPEATSRCAGSTDRIEGLFEPALLQDGQANPDNKWARFVFATVNYLVQEKGVTTYQIWNEPDEQWLHGGPLNTEDKFEDDYVQMVKVAGEAAEQAGGDVLVLGAPSSNEDLYKPGGWVHTVWGNLGSSAAVDRLDAIAIHAYDWPFQTWSIAERARGLIGGKPIWVTESGLALCDRPACGGYCTRDPADFIGLDFDPEAAAQTYAVLLIPSGGLFGLENDAIFRARLEEYARQGGVIVAFAQQHGYEYAALPGGEVNGYGWNEDISCFKAALRMETWHPILAVTCSPARCRVVLIIVIYLSPCAPFPTA